MNATCVDIDFRTPHAIDARLPPFLVCSMAFIDCHGQSFTLLEGQGVGAAELADLPVLDIGQLEPLQNAIDESLPALRMLRLQSQPV